jgi:hypothetical protein
MIASFVVALPFCLLIALAFGLPTFLLMAKLNLVRWWAWLPLSFLFGWVLAIATSGASAGYAALEITLPIAIVAAFAFRVVWAASATFRRKHAGRPPT